MSGTSPQHDNARDSHRDYERCLNLRDVGHWVNDLAGAQILPEGRILRGGRLTDVRTVAEIHSPATIVNLRRGPDPEEKRFGCDYRHFPIANDFEVYDTSTREVRAWLESVFRFLAEPGVRFPVFFHCTSGRDRTGVVVAILLRILGVDRRVIVEEYRLSEPQTQAQHIEGALEGVGDPSRYLRRVDLDAVRRNAVGT